MLVSLPRHHTFRESDFTGQPQTLIDVSRHAESPLIVRCDDASRLRCVIYCRRYVSHDCRIRSEREQTQVACRSNDAQVCASRALQLARRRDACARYYSLVSGNSGNIDVRTRYRSAGITVVSSWSVGGKCGYHEPTVSSDRAVTWDGRISPNDGVVGARPCIEGLHCRRGQSSRKQRAGGIHR
jgi:hypothetical protein